MTASIFGVKNTKPEPSAAATAALRADLERELSGMKALMTARDAVSTGYVTEAQIYGTGLRRRAGVPKRKVGGKVFIPKAEFIEWLCEGCKENRAKPL